MIHTDHQADKVNALAANVKLDADRIKIEQRERELLGAIKPGDEDLMAAEDAAQLDRLAAEHVRLSKAMQMNVATIQRAEGLEDDKAKDVEDQEEDPDKDEEMAASAPLGRGPSGGNVSFADIEQALVEQGPQRNQTVLSLTLPTMKFRGRQTLDADGNPDGGVAAARFAGFAGEDLDLSTAGLPGIERLAINVGHGSTLGTSGLEFPEITIDIINALWDVSRIQSWARVMSTDHGNKIKPSVRRQLSGAGGGTTPWGTPNYEAESAEIDARDPQYISGELNTYKLAEMNFQSYEVLRDHVPGDIRSNVVSAAMLWLGLSLGHEAAVGAGGANAPTGIVTELAKAANNSRRVTVPKATAAGDGVLAGDRGPRISDLQKGIHAIPDAYVTTQTADCAILTSWGNGAHFRRLRVPESGYWFMERDKSGATLGSIEGGIPVVCSPGFPTFARDSKASAVFGCWSMFMLRYVGGPRIDFSWDYKFQNDQLSVRAIQEFDCLTLDPAAFYAWDAQDVA